MKIFFILSLCVACLAGPVEDTLKSFQNFKTMFNRQYSSSAEEAQRLGCFVQTLATIEEMNAIDTAQHGINNFADLCADEFKMYHNLKFTKKVNQGRMFSPQEVAATATDIDWRQQGAVTAVKNQASCGSCWAFSTVAALEGAWKLAGNALTSLSEEELVQCAKSAGQGCQGGEMSDAIKWVISNKGINSEKAYPYTSGWGITGQCNAAKSAVAVANFSAIVQVPKDEAQIATYLAKYGPLSIAVDATQGWQTYTGGVKATCTMTELDHGVAIVGMTSDYWIVRNSWAASWGEAGYIRLKRGVDCNGLSQDVNTATV